MMSIRETDFDYTDDLSKILEHPRLRDRKYSSPNYRRVSIMLCHHSISKLPNVFYASAMFLKMLFERYGDISFQNALDLWEKSHVA